MDRSVGTLLLERDLVTERERNPLRLGADADVPHDLAVRLPPLNRHVHERVLAEVGACVQVCGEEPRRAAERGRRSEAAHIGRLDHVREELAHVGDLRVHSHLVLPLELGPHGAEEEVGARRGRDVVHDVDVDIVQHDARAVSVERARRVVDDRAEDDAGLRGGHLDVGAHRAALAGREGVRLRPLAQLEVANGGELEAEVGHRLGGLIDDCHVEDDVVLVHRDEGLGVHRVRKASELSDALQALGKVLRLLAPL
mmetsp:Transcript_21988/g.51126  ORF Transcript_21988/g.51126 Transcript_21988/m.51126 type:complete len:255 (+) Transcript_21988:250-1014(+)